MHVYLYPLTEVVTFNFAHTEPAFTEAIAFVGINRERATVSAVSGFFIGPVSGQYWGLAITNKSENGHCADYSAPNPDQ